MVPILRWWRACYFDDRLAAVSNEMTEEDYQDQDGPRFVSRSWALVAVESSVRRSKAKAIHNHAKKSHTPNTTTIAGYRRTLVLDNQTAYHGYFDFLRLEAGFELSSSWIIDFCYGSSRNRSGLIFMRWTHIDLGAQDLNGIQRPKLKFRNR
jgi:hypothetical protein